MKWTLDEGKEYLQEGEDGHDLPSAAPKNKGVWTLIKLSPPPCECFAHLLLHCCVLWRKKIFWRVWMEKMYSSTNIRYPQTTCTQPTSILLTTCTQPTSVLLSTCTQPTCVLLTTCTQPTSVPQTTCTQPTSELLTTCTQPTSVLLTTCTQPTSVLQTTFTQPTSVLLTTCVLYPTY